jgi:hypothetical protein
MKIELVKEVTIDGDRYSVEIDGSYVRGTICESLIDALTNFNRVVKFKQSENIKQTIQSVEL